MPLTTMQPKRWTRDEYYRLAGAGLIRQRKVELIEGDIIEMSPQNLPHATALELIARLLHRRLPARLWIRTQLPLLLGASEPEPDFAVVEGEPRRRADHPVTAALVVEVAETSLEYDLGDKASLYAAHGIADYWVVSLAHRTVHVLRSPQADAAAPFGHAYAARRVLRAGDKIAPLAASDVPIAVDDMLP